MCRQIGPFVAVHEAIQFLRLYGTKPFPQQFKTREADFQAV